MIDKKPYNYTPLPYPIPITQQVWAADILPLVHTRTMTYMHENYIRECIEGLLIQKTTFPVHILIHDDASTDKTVEIIKEYEDRFPNIVKAFYQKENSYSQKNKLERRGEFSKWRIGKYEATCEGDDYWIDPLKLQKQVEFLEHNSDYGLIFTDTDVKIQKSKKIIPNYNKTYHKVIPQGNVIDTLLYGNPYKSCTSLIKMDLIKEYYKTDFSKKLFKMGDIKLYLFLANKCKVGYLQDSTAVYRIQNLSASHFVNINQAKLFKKSHYKVSLYFASTQNIHFDKNKFKKNYINFLITFCITHNQYKHLLSLMHKPLAILKITIKEKLIKPFINFV